MFMERKWALVYHKDSDSLYQLDLAPNLSFYNRWKYFIPFYEYSFTNNVVMAEYRGKLSDLQDQARKDARLIRDDPAASRKALIDDVLKSVQDLKNRKDVGGFEFSYLFVELFRRRDIDANALVPDSWKKAIGHVADDDRNVFSADIVVMEWRVTRKSGKRQTNPVEVTTLRKVVYVEGPGKYYGSVGHVLISPPE